MRLTILKKLLRYPHKAVFDKSPEAGIALRINRPLGINWAIADEILTLRFEGIERSYNLSGFTVGTLSNKLQDDGIYVAGLEPYFAGRSARVLIEGVGNSAEHGGDTLLGFKSDLWVTYAAYASELREAKTQVSEALKQMIITQAEGEWLDLWGALYDVPRKILEPDQLYQHRIPEEAFRLRLNRYAIKKAVKDLTGHMIFIRETWPFMFRLDESRLSSTSRLVDNEQWRYGYIQPVAKYSFDWSDALEVIERNKGAGIIVLKPLVEIEWFIDAQVDGDVSFGVLSEFGAYIRPTFDFRVDVLRLSETNQHRNWVSRIDIETVITNTVSGGTWETIEDGWPAIPWSEGMRPDAVSGATSFLIEHFEEDDGP